MDAVTEKVFLSAWDLYRKSNRWSAFALGLGILFHLVFFWQFLSISGAVKGSEEAEQNLKSRQAALEPVQESLAEVQSAIEDIIRPAMAKLLGDLRRDFDRGNEQLELLRKGAGADLGAPPPLDDRMQMSSEFEALSGRSLKLEDDRWKEILPLQGAAFLRAIRPDVEEQLIQPRFAELNRTLRTDLREAIRKPSKNLEKHLAALSSSESDSGKVSAQLGSGVRDLLKKIDSLVIEPPKDPLWWGTVKGKIEAIFDAESEALQLVEGSPLWRSLSGLESELDDALAEEDVISAQLREELDTLESVFAKQSTALASVVRPFEILATDLEFIVSRFPLLIGLLLAAITAWKGLRIREVHIAAHLASKAGVPLPETMLRLIGPTSRTRLAGEAAFRVAVGCGWVALASWQLTQSSLEAQGTWIILSACLVLVAAEAYRVHLGNRMLNLESVPVREQSS